LTLEALAARDITCAGLVLGCWPSAPDLAARSNVADLRAMAPLVGAVPEGASGDPRDWLAPPLGGRFDADQWAGSV
ncbi:MAG: dethiobiotin synthetase, partial [Actinomycetota bacterium]|nr:dethiobiotin synthetase [Actinomycetota bacterium]